MASVSHAPFAGRLLHGGAKAVVLGDKIVIVPKAEHSKSRGMQISESNLRFYDLLRIREQVSYAVKEDEAALSIVRDGCNGSYRSYVKTCACESMRYLHWYVGKLLEKPENARQGQFYYRHLASIFASEAASSKIGDCKVAVAYAAGGLEALAKTLGAGPRRAGSSNGRRR